MTDDVSPTASIDLVPGWLRRLAAIGWRVLAVIAMALVLIQIALVLSTVTASTIVASIFAATFAPYVQSCRARGWGRAKSAAAVSGVALLVVTVAGILMFVAIAPHVGDVVGSIKAGISALQQEVADANISPELSALLNRLVDDVEQFAATVAGRLVGPIASAVTVAILGGFLTFFLMMDGDRAWAWLIEPIKGWRAAAITKQGEVALDRVGGYLRGTAVLATIRGLSSFAFLVLLGVPYAGPLAVIAFLGAFVPYVGGLIAMVIMLLVAYDQNGPTTAFILFILLAGLGLILGRVVGPVIYGRTVDVHPALVLIALPAGATLFGVIGLVGALPFLALVIAMTPALILALDLEPDSDLPRSDLVPTWLDRLGQWSWRGLVVAALGGIAIAGIVAVPIVFIPLILAIVLAATLDSTTERLRRRGWSRGRAALAITLGSAFAITGIVVVTLAMMVGPLQEMLSTSFDGASTGVLGATGVDRVVQAYQDGFSGAVVSLLSNLASAGLILLLSTLLTFYLLRDGEANGRRVVMRLGPVRGERLAAVGGRATQVLGGYMIGTGVVSLFGAGTMALVMFILGLPLILPIFVLSFFLGFIPYIGGFIGTALAFLVTVAVGDTTDIVVMFIFTIVFNIAQGNFVAPLVYGRTVSLHPAIVLMAIPAGSEIAGIIGMFLVVPLLGVVSVTWRTVVHMFDPRTPHAEPADAATAHDPPPGKATPATSGAPPEAAAEAG
jgi:predicted PurR-regulated permease PerM